MSVKPSVLFVCLGNICRSPLAEAAFREAVNKSGVQMQIDSCGTGDWHIGHAPDRRAQAVARKHGIDIRHYRARQVTTSDFSRYSHIVAMDRNNLADLEALRPAHATAQISLMLDYLWERQGQDVADPYYGDADGFDVTWSDVSSAAAALLKTLLPAKP